MWKIVMQSYISEHFAVIIIRREFEGDWHAILQFKMIFSR